MALSVTAARPASGTSLRTILKVAKVGWPSIGTGLHNSVDFAFKVFYITFSYMGSIAAHSCSFINIPLQILLFKSLFCALSILFFWIIAIDSCFIVIQHT